MLSLDDTIDKIFAKRKLKGGEFTYVHIQSGKSVSGKKAALAILKDDEEEYSRIEQNFKLLEENKDVLDSRLLKLIQNVKYETNNILISNEVNDDQKRIQLTDLIARRRLEEGKFTYVYKPLEKIISGKESIYHFLKSQIDDFNSLKNSCKKLDETDEQFNDRMLEELQMIPFEVKTDDYNTIQSKKPVKKVMYSNFVSSSSREHKKVQSEGFILPPKTFSQPPTFESVVKTSAELTPFEAEIVKFKTTHEPKHQWELKKKFMMAHKDTFQMMELVGLAQTFGNIEFMGCTYPKDTMRQVRLKL